MPSDWESGMRISLSSHKSVLTGKQMWEIQYQTLVKLRPASPGPSPAQTVSGMMKARQHERAMDVSFMRAPPSCLAAEGVLEASSFRVRASFTEVAHP